MFQISKWTRCVISFKSECNHDYDVDSGYIVLEEEHFQIEALEQPRETQYLIRSEAGSRPWGKRRRMSLRLREGNSVRTPPSMDSRFGSCLVSDDDIIDKIEGNCTFTSILLLENKAAEKLFWVVMVFLGFIFVSVMLTEAVIDWINFPTRKEYIMNVNIKS